MRIDIYTSQTIDGSMKPVNGDDEIVFKNRKAFLNKNDIRLENTTLLLSLIHI